jgi:DNA-binding protein HU-beta
MVMKKALSSAQLLRAVADRVGEDVSLVQNVLETIVTIGQKELRWNDIFVLPGFAKFVVVTKAARPAREGVHPFTRQSQRFAATPESRTLRATPVKAMKVAARCGKMASPAGPEVGNVAHTPAPNTEQEVDGVEPLGVENGEGAA